MRRMPDHQRARLPGPIRDGASAAAVSAAILVGGRARRMHGLDKSTLDVDGLPILERQLAVLRQLSDDLLIVTRAGAPRDGAISSEGERALRPARPAHRLGRDIGRRSARRHTCGARSCKSARDDRGRLRYAVPVARVPAASGGEGRRNGCGRAADAGWISSVVRSLRSDGQAFRRAAAGAGRTSKCPRCFRWTYASPNSVLMSWPGSIQRAACCPM